MSDKPEAQGPIRSSGRQVYDLTESETNELTREFLRTKTISTPDRFVCFQIEGSDPFANIARQIEREVFAEAFGNDSVTMAREYGPYEESSVFFLAVDTHAEVPAGVLRMIRNSPAGLKTLIDLEDRTKTPITVNAADVLRYHGIDHLDRCWDGATSAVRRRYRRCVATIHVQLLRAWHGAALRENVEHFVSILDARVFKIVRDYFGVPLVPLADTSPFTYLGAPNSQAVYARVTSSLPNWAGANRKVGQRIRDSFADLGSREREHLLETPHHAG
jgi:hypothetical protein